MNEKGEEEGEDDKVGKDENVENESEEANDRPLKVSDDPAFIFEILHLENTTVAKYKSTDEKEEELFSFMRARLPSMDKKMREHSYFDESL